MTPTPPDAVRCFQCGGIAMREFCYAAEPWVPYCGDCEPQYGTVGERPLVKRQPPAADAAPLRQRTRHGGNVGPTPFYLQPGQREPEYDSGDAVVVWYDDLILIQEDIDNAVKRAEVAERELAALQADAAPLRTLREQVKAWRNAAAYVDPYTGQSVPLVVQRALWKCADELDALLPKETP